MVEDGGCQVGGMIQDEEAEGATAIAALQTAPASLQEEAKTGMALP